MLKKIIKDKIDWIMIIAGSCIAAYNGSRMVTYTLLEFGSSAPGDLQSRLMERMGFYPLPKYTFWFAIAIGLIVWGILIYRDKRIVAK